jgi:alkylation response protein AidB-like acyl-CoA dehydrogenase
MTMSTEDRNAQGSEHETVIDTSGMSEGKKAALELAESSRQTHWKYPTFAGALFMGELPLKLIHPYPQLPEDRDEKGESFLIQLEEFLRDKTDPDQIDRDGEIPDEVIEGLAKIGTFGVKVPREYGGLGLKQQYYSRAAVLLGSHCGNLCALVSAHQSIGVPQPLLVFGTDDQKKKFLTRVAAGEISAFALTEEGAGSDPAKMETRAEPTPDGDAFILNGRKLWCTNGTRAGLIVVMAKTPPKLIKGRSRDQITAFVVDMNSPGIRVVNRCRFMGLRALYNAVIEFKDVRVPKENIIAGEGEGLRVALTTLNTGRLTLPALCVGIAKRALEVATDWASKREQWGAPIGKHGAIADKIARIASTLFAMEAMTNLTALLVDRKKTDIRVEAAMAKAFCTEAAWWIVNETTQILGGRGYETNQSLEDRGEKPNSLERALRDCRINLIFEGSSEIMRLFIAREAMDPHLSVAGEAMNPRRPMGRRLKAALRAAVFYAVWYPRQWLPRQVSTAGLDPALKKHVRYVSKTSRKLARRMFHAMLKHGPKLEREQMLLARFVDAGTELFAIAASATYAQALLDKGVARKEVLPLVEHFAAESRGRIDTFFSGVKHNNDRMGYRLAQQMLEGPYDWMLEGVVGESKPRQTETKETAPEKVTA